MEVINKKINSLINLELIKYLENRVRARLLYELKEEVVEVIEPEIGKDGTFLSDFIIRNRLSNYEVILLLLTLIPHLLPSFYTKIIEEYVPEGGEFPEFGGVKGKSHRGILPTVETALYILSGNYIANRLLNRSYILYENRLIKNKIMSVGKVSEGEPLTSAKLILSEEYVHLFLTGKELKPQLSQDFPASLITTDLEWDDLVLQEKTLNDVKEIENWLAYKEILMNDWGMSSKIKPGYRVLFCGLPGTGKTLTAGLLGKHTGKDVYRVDLSMVVSKYIGETEKNLSKLFDKSINKDWILFFDEADSIFGKRTSVRDAHDKYANQEVSYLLQRIEAHPGLIILASNFKNNIDTAFTRRFNNIIEFETPNYEERLVLWKKNLPNKIELEGLITIEELAKKFNITGANIVNAVQYACLKTIANKENKILRQYILEGIKREYTKEGRTTNISI
ncbi:ATP-binding protein [Tenacibaculum sp. 1B UA]|uniref:ATP-binding protein n=1 Tax=Tenacibaculum sp. 1B UA TaxID=2922252 RepID=UPI002A245154|nr:ATP-binding protein [Tenacibaculum sp. 1B UA]MDX8553690.1 ATP-binding protein [Tenacibaculum sp. 1B UA]